jgi:hypothetical protein
MKKSEKTSRKKPDTAALINPDEIKFFDFSKKANTITHNITKLGT